MSARRLSSVILGLSGAFTVVGIGLIGVTLSVPQSATDWGFRGFPALFAITFSTVGWVIARRQPGNALGWLFGSVGLLSAAAVLCQGYAFFGEIAHPGSLPLAVWAAWLYSWTWIPTITLAGVHALLIFPDGHLPGPGWRVVAWLGAAIAVVVSAGIALTPGPLQNFAVLRNPIGVGPTIDPAVQSAGIGALGATMAAAASTLVLRFRNSTGIARQQLKWIAFAAVLVAVSLAPSGLYSNSTGLIPKLAQLVVIVAFASVPVAVGIAVLRYRLYDIDLLINRTAVYGSVTVVLAALFAAANIGVQRLLESVTGQSSDLVTAGLAVTAALSFAPLRRAVRPIVDRLLPSRALLTLLFVDIVGSTEAIVELGDARWQPLLARFRAVVRQELGRHGGREVNTAGDAFGGDMSPGTWRSAGGSSGCYAARLSGFGGTLDQVISNDLASEGGLVVTIGAGDAGFETNGCGTWTKVS